MGLLSLRNKVLGGREISQASLPLTLVGFWICRGGWFCFGFLWSFTSNFGLIQGSQPPHVSNDSALHHTGTDRFVAVHEIILPMHTLTKDQQSH